VWLGKIGDLLDLKAEAEDLERFAETLREVATSTDSLGESVQATAAQLQERLSQAECSAAGAQQLLDERLKSLEANVAEAPSSLQVLTLSSSAPSSCSQVFKCIWAV
jgi:predicted nuclease with TOPRIM domain